MNTPRLTIAIPFLAVLLPSTVNAQVTTESEAKAKMTTVKVDPNDKRGIWEGWGCSMGWWPNMVGGRHYENLYSDLFFTTKTVPFLDAKLPGLDMNIVRYNVGGGGSGGKWKGLNEKVPDIQPWPRRIDGFWLNGDSRDPKSISWDWSRDSAQRSVLKGAVKRGVNKVEFYSNAPMWWMMDSQSSAGGRLLPQFKESFAYYLATVTEQAERKWGVKVNYLQPFNEPSAGWWNYPKNQEGANFKREDQLEIYALLRKELDSRGLKSVTLTASDENNVHQAFDTHEFFKKREVQVNGKLIKGDSLYEKVNVHSYSGLEPMRDNPARERLLKSVGSKRLWANEFGDNDAGGMKLVQTIMEDLTYLRPTAWLYWQPLEPASPWGLVNGYQLTTADPPESGKPTQYYTKYFAFAQFTRFLKQGAQVIGSNDPNTVVGYEAEKRRLTFITVNYGEAKKLTFDFSNFKRVGAVGQLTQTYTDGSKRFESSEVAVKNGKVELNLVPNSVHSLVIDKVTIN